MVAFVISVQWITVSENRFCFGIAFLFQNCVSCPECRFCFGRCRFYFRTTFVSQNFAFYFQNIVLFSEWCFHFRIGVATLCHHRNALPQAVAEADSLDIFKRHMSRHQQFWSSASCTMYIVHTCSTAHSFISGFNLRTCFCRCWSPWPRSHW